MAMIQRFEDLLCWQKARQLTNAVYDLTDSPAFTKDFQLRNQIRDAAGSSMHNIAEGFDSGTPSEFIRFLRIARRSASEVQSELHLALDRQYIDQNRLTLPMGSPRKPSVSSMAWSRISGREEHSEVVR
jgi:four helix bundle protein